MTSAIGCGGRVGFPFILGVMTGIVLYVLLSRNTQSTCSVGSDEFQPRVVSRDPEEIAQKVCNQGAQQWPLAPSYN